MGAASWHKSLQTLSIGSGCALILGHAPVAKEVCKELCSEGRYLAGHWGQEVEQLLLHVVPDLAAFACTAVHGLPLFEATGRGATT